MRLMMDWLYIQMPPKSLAQLEAGRGSWSLIASMMPLLLTVPLIFALSVYLSPPLTLPLDWAS